MLTCNLILALINNFSLQDWDSINDLRVDMGRIQQRMDNLQRMLESCMEMQLELQRSIRQELSAAMHRSADPSGFSIRLMSLCDSTHDDSQYKIMCIYSLKYYWVNDAPVHNRFTGPSKDTESYESKWEYVRKGICCICCESNIDSLLYR